MRFFLAILSILFCFPVFSQHIADHEDELLIVGSVYEPSDPNPATFIQELTDETQWLTQVKDSVAQRMIFLQSEKGYSTELVKSQALFDTCEDIIRTNQRILAGKAKIRRDYMAATLNE